MKILFLVICVSIFLRTYNINNNLHFTGDEGRDALIAQEIISGKNFPILGPSSSIGDLSLGPLYYYLIAPFALISNSDPTFLAIPVITFSVLTSVLLYCFGRDVFKNNTIGTLSAFFYAIFPLAVYYGRFSWNPNIMPFFSLLYFYALFKFVKREKLTYIALSAVALGFVVQSHYVGLLVLPASIAYFWKSRKTFTRKPKYLLYSGLIFCTMISPLIYYDLNRGFKNIKGILTLFGSGDTFTLQAHYFEMLWPFGVLALAYLVFKFMQTNVKLGLIFITFVSLLMFNSSFSIAKEMRHPSLAGIKNVAELVVEKSEGKPFNFAVLSDYNREDSYAYFFKAMDSPVELSYPTSQLFVVCEDNPDCRPQGHPKYEIAIFDVKYNGQVTEENRVILKDYYTVVKLVPK